MQPSAALAASDRPAGLKESLLNGLMRWLAPALLPLLVLPAQAGDRALIDYVGFSEDFRYFAFEEFGIQDGSGFAYANLYVVDLESDSWVVGTPITVRADDSERSLADVRAEARAGAESHLEGFGIDVPVEIAALIGDGVTDTDAKNLAFGAPGYYAGTVSGDYTLKLGTFMSDAVSPCVEWFGETALGYQLSIEDSGTSRLIHRDEDALPRSRGCPSDYRLYSVVMPFQGLSLSHAVALISYYPGGFEGPDRRFLAVPLGL